MLVIPFRAVPRLTDLHAEEVTDLFVTVQKVEKMLERKYFPSTPSSEPSSTPNGSFNVALQDGPESGQTVPHVHVHVIPRLKDDRQGDGVYDRLQGEEGNVGGGWWDRELGKRPVQKGRFPRVEDKERKARETEEMNAEARELRALMEELQ